MFAQLTILAPGLLGGSVAQAARAKGAVGKIVVWARRPEDRQALRGQTWCDGVADSPEEAVLGATLVIVSAPVDRIVPLIAQVTPTFRQDRQMLPPLRKANTLYGLRIDQHDVKTLMHSV